MFDLDPIRSNKHISFSEKSPLNKTLKFENVDFPQDFPCCLAFLVFNLIINLAITRIGAVKNDYDICIYSHVSSAQWYK